MDDKQLTSIGEQHVVRQKGRGGVDKEVWRAIEGYEGLYEVSNMGRVKSVDRVLPHKKHGTWHIRERILKQNWTGKDKGVDGYLFVFLHSGHGEQRIFRVHRLVAEAFVPRIPGKDVVNHIDCDRSNNHADNLEWCTNMENTTHAWEHGRCENIGKYQRRPVINLDTGERFESIRAAAKAYHLTDGSINAAVIGDCATSAGFRWQYEDEYNAGKEHPHPRNLAYSPVIQIDKETGKEIARFPSVQSAAKETGTCKNSISACCRGRYHTGNGYVWRYAI